MSSPLTSCVLRLSCLSALALMLAGAAYAGDLNVKIPKRSKPTPVQKLNQDGVKALSKHDYKRAKKLFYAAYLLDPDDPFTLNNLGYVAELDGEIDRAQRYYSLASEQHSDAVVSRATTEAAMGKAVGVVAGRAADQQMQVNRLNIYAMGLLEKDRAPEADVTLQKALKIDPKNPFTLNNLGYAKEREGELHEAYHYYSQSAASGSREPVVVSVHPNWRGKPIGEVADANAKKVLKEMNKPIDTDTRVARLNLRGVSAINRNERATARQYFQQAYKLDPTNAFTLNNMGYLSEMDGDRETADFFYAKAHESLGSGSKVVAATRKSAEGQRLGDVANESDNTVSQAQEATVEARRREGATPVELKRRDGSPVVNTPEQQEPSAQSPTSNPAEEPAIGPSSQQPSNARSAPTKKPPEVIRPIEDPGPRPEDNPEPQQPR